MIKPLIRFPLALLLVGAPIHIACAQPADIPADVAERAQRVTIIRDDWGVAHVRGKTDADAVFGMIYAQAEDDFNRIETNYLTALGRMAEGYGEDWLWQDLRARLYMDPDKLKADYAASPQWLKKLMTAWADGLNHYLATHPNVKPKAINHFEPWMALSFPEGSIGGDIERIPLKDLAAFYGDSSPAKVAQLIADEEPRGSNGIAIAPSRTRDGKALLLINPHTSFFFRSELQMTSDEGLNAYGAVTWGQFFIYQGFNASAGWMHTSSGVDVVDEFAETIERRDGKLGYRHGRQWRPLQTAEISLNVRRMDGTLNTRSFTTYRSHHGPIIRSEGDKWIAFAMMDKPVPAIEQSFLRTKTKDLASFLKVARRQANSSNNTLFASSKGEIAYLHPQFVPVRSNAYDYTKIIDGSDPKADWQGLHSLDTLPQALNPASGWAMNTNNWPWTAAGAQSPKADEFPRYMDTFGENPRGVHAVRLLDASAGLTVDGLRTLAFDPAQPAFETLVPSLLAAIDGLAADDPRRKTLAEPAALLRGWDLHWAEDSTANTLATFWAEEMWRRAQANEADEALPIYDRIANAPVEARLDALSTVLAKLEQDFGRWQVPWGEVNRFQRLTGDIVQPFSDAGKSIPVGFGSARWGSLASFGARPYPGTRRWYGTSGNSFVAVVEFGDRVKAMAVTAGGESGDPASAHFNDQAMRYAQGALRPVYFYPDELSGHIERQYHPGQQGHDQQPPAR